MKNKTATDILRQYKSGYKEFKGVIVATGDFSETRLVGIIFEGATLMGCNFERAVLQRASFSAANLRGANFRGANLAKADLKGSDFRGAIMRAVDLSKADLRWANLEGVNLSGSIISGANFDGANLKNASLKGTDPGKLWWKANLEEAKLENTIMPDGTVFGQVARPKLDYSIETIEPAEVVEPVKTMEVAGPNYRQADRLYYEGLGIIASIQTQTQAGAPLNHPKIQRLMKEAVGKFQEAMKISDVNWAHFSECDKYNTKLVFDMVEGTAKD